VGESALDLIAQQPERAGLFLDFDGTLSDIAPTPGGARALDGAAALLPALAERYRGVAIVSGRRATDVAERLAIGLDSPILCFGLYGLEDLHGAAPAVALSLATIRAALPDVERAAAFVPGAVVEGKGAQVAVHYRAATDATSARRVLLERLSEVAKRSGLRLLEGKKVVELAPARAPTKGDVVARVARDERLEAILYAGDDVADLAAFATLDGLAADGIATLKVAVRSSETPDEVLRQADLVVEGPARLVELLRSLATP
jgi:trehalose 6-phosphate phosphatase